MTKKSIVKSTLVRFDVAEGVTMELPYKPIDWNTASQLSASSQELDQSIILGFFISKQPPTWAEYQEAYKVINPKAPKPNKRNGHNDMYQKLRIAGQIQLAVDNGFKPLEAWNAEAHKAKKSRLHNMTINGLHKLAKAFIPSDKPELTAEDIATKAIISAYKKMQECHGKVWQAADKKMVALMASLNIELPSAEAEGDTEE
jgi:hypothetical protein